MVEMKPIPNAPRYVAGADGRIYSMCPGRHNQWTGLHPIRPWTNAKGYLQVALELNGSRKSFTVHRLIGKAFLGLRPEGRVIHHRNGDSGDNRPENLQYITQVENNHHRDRMGRTAKGERNGQAKFSDAHCLSALAALHERQASGDMARGRRRKNLQTMGKVK